MIINSGASTHYVHSEDYMCNIKLSVSQVYGIGDIKIFTQSRETLLGEIKTHEETMAGDCTLLFAADVTHVPALTVSLFSVAEACKQGYHIHFEGHLLTGLHGMQVRETDE